MFQQILLWLFIGIFFGIITGLTPGIHINLISLILLSMAPALLGFTSPISLGAFIIGMAVTHTFLDSIPGIYLGAPDEAMALSVLPGHRMLLKGEGHNALKLTVIGSFFSLVLCIIISPFLINIVNFAYPIVKNYIGHILIVVMTYMILKDNKKVWNLIIFLLSGSLGLIVLNYSTLKNPLFPMLSGLFGFSVLIISLMQNSKIPKQNLSAKLGTSKKEIARATMGATSVGFIASFLPGFGSSQAAILATQFLKNMSEKGFLVLIGGINTVNMTLSLITFYVIDKARNGAIIALSKIVGEMTTDVLVIYFCLALITGSTGVVLALNISKIFSKIITKINYRILVLSILSFITLLTFYFSGILGFLLLFVSTMLGLTASELGVGKNHCLGCLILPVILFFML